MRLAIIIPMYNEQEVAAESLVTILPFVRELPDTTFVIVDDGSKDATASIVSRFIQKEAVIPIELLRHENNQGYGAALRTGIRYAQTREFDYVLFMDSDLTNHPKYLKLFYTKIAEGADYIKATRYRKGGGMDGVPWKGRAFSRVGNLIAQALFRTPLSDITNGFRAVKVDLYKDVELEESGFAIIMEELYRLKPRIKKYAEVPYILTSRASDQGKSHFHYNFQTMLTYLSYAVRSCLNI